MKIEPAITPEPLVTSWSFSAIKQRQRCAFMYYLRRIQREPGPPEDPDAPNVRGSRIHKSAEDYIKGEVDILNADLCRYRDHFKILRTEFHKGHVTVEQPWYFDENWEQATAENYVGIVICDAVVYNPARPIMRVIDFKTGKRYGNEITHTQQVQLYAIAAFMLHPEVEFIETELWYIDHPDKRITRIISREQLPTLMKFWQMEIDKHLSCISFPATPTKGKCKWCDYGWAKTNVCPYSTSD